MKQLVIVVFVLNGFVAQTTDDLVIHCSNNCLDYLNSATPQSAPPTQENNHCNVTENVPPTYEDSIPGPKAEFQDVHWYVEEHKGEILLAINITWFENGYWPGQKLHNGYHLQIVPSQSIGIVYNVIVQAKNQPSSDSDAKHQYEKIYFNYKCYGLNKDTFIRPGKIYLIVLKTLPVTSQDVDQLFSSEIVVIPDCTEDFIKETKNCKQEEEPGTTEWSSSTMDTTTEYTEPSLECCDYSLYVISSIAVFMAIGLLVLAVVYRQSFQQPGTFPVSKKVVVMIDTLQAANQTAIAHAGDELARGLAPYVGSVTYSLWNATEINKTGLVDWVVDKVSKADCVVMLCIHETESKSSEEPLLMKDGSCSKAGMNETLLSVLNNRIDRKPTVAAVHFGGQTSKCAWGRRTYKLPDKTEAFLSCVTGKPVPAGSVKYIQKQLSYWLNPNDWKRDEILLRDPYFSVKSSDRLAQVEANFQV